MAELNLYPRAIYRDSGFEGILSANGTGEDYRTMGVGCTDINIGMIVFDNAVSSRKSSACILTGLQTQFEMKNGNSWATNDIQFTFIPYKTAGTINGNIFSASTFTELGDRQHNDSDSNNWVSKTFDYFSQNVDSSGLFGTNKYVGFYAMIHRDGGYVKTQAYMRNLRAKITYTPKFYAKFYAVDNTQIGITQTIDANAAPTAPAAANIANYSFVGWKNTATGTIYTAENIPAGYDEDVSYIATYAPIMHTINVGSYDMSKCTVHVRQSSSDVIVPSGGSMDIQQGAAFSIVLMCNPDSFEGNPVYDVSYSINEVEYLLTRDDLTKVNEKYIYTIYQTNSFNGDVTISNVSIVLTNLVIHSYVESATLPVMLVTRYMSTQYLITALHGYYLDASYDNRQCNVDIQYDNGNILLLFSNVKANCVVRFTQTPRTYEVKTNTDGRGTISGNSSIEYERNATYTITPNTNYNIRDVKLDGVSVLDDVTIVDTVGTLTLTEVTESHTVDVEFMEVINLALTITGNGSVNGYTTNTTLAIPKNELYLINLESDTDNSVDTITVDSVQEHKAALKEAKYNFEINPTADTTVAIAFTDSLSQITIETPENGQICGAESGEYLNGTVLKLYARANVGAGLTKWDNDSTNHIREYTVSQDAIITATFTLFTYRLTSESINDHGTVIPAEIYGEYGEEVVFTAVPEPGYKFNDRWYNNLGMSTMGIFYEIETGISRNTLSYTISESGVIGADFVKDYFILTVSGTTGGAVTGSGTYEFESEHEITATPLEGYYFFRWSDGDCNPTRIITIPAENLALTAEFRKIEFDIDVDAGEGGTVIVNKSVNYGDDLNVVITTDIDYKISNVTVNGTSVYKQLTTAHNGGSFVVSSVKSNINIVVYFAENEYKFNRKLLDYYPPVLQNVLELIKITDAQQFIVGTAWGDIDFVMSAQFIDSANVESVEIWENELNIIPKATDTLYQRKERLKALWVPNSRYTFRWIKQWLLTFATTAKSTVSDYTLNVELPMATDYAYLTKQIRHFIPANINLNPKIALTPNSQKLFAATINVVGITKTSEEPEAYIE